ncbi:hypothetical protein BSF38_04792 [Paludisphaera borealis]|uniref:Uncharacterized protein n=1 Tax=Paludisphaera borealis TaxID=1387353 RepID=A0A1U7CWF7_9BACT|nr:hypothetical protein BSF38_04792 [Paludisphaera borealis]
MTSARRLDVAARLAAESLLPLDRLPYTPAFDDLYARYVKEIGRDCSRHDCWWALVDARKRGLVGSSRRRPHDPDRKE